MRIAQRISTKNNNSKIERSHSKLLIKLIDDTLNNNKLKIADIDIFSISKGPGSYTGLRIGLSSIKGFCYALNKPLVSINTLKILAISALENIDEVISIIRGSKDPEAAKKALIEKFSFSEKQTKAILDMRLQKLTSLEIDKVVDEYNELQNLIKKLNESNNYFKLYSCLFSTPFCYIIHHWKKR